MKNNCKGYTLIEVLISLVIVSVAVAGMMSVFLVGMRQTSQSSNKAASAQEAAKLLEKLKISLADDFTSLPSGLQNPPWHAGCKAGSVLASSNYDANGNITGGLDALAGDVTAPDRCDHIFYDATAGDTVSTTHYIHLNSSFFSPDFFTDYKGRLRYLVWDNLGSSPTRYTIAVISDWTEATQ